VLVYLNLKCAGPHQFCVKYRDASLKRPKSMTQSLLFCCILNAAQFLCQWMPPPAAKANFCSSRCRFKAPSRPGTTSGGGKAGSNAGRPVCDVPLLSRHAL